MVNTEYLTSIILYLMKRQEQLKKEQKHVERLLIHVRNLKFKEENKNGKNC